MLASPPVETIRRPATSSSSGERGRPAVRSPSELSETRGNGGRKWLRWSLTSLAAVAVCAGAMERLYRRHLRAWVLTWGATAEEVAGRLPGDELLEPADIVSTRAIGIEAPPSAIWPWLVQMGPGRAGAYTYDWIENLFGLDMHSADQIVPEWQRLEAGDVLRSHEDRPGMRVEIIEPERILSSRSEAGDWVWTFALAPQDGSTRLVSRNRIAAAGAAAGQRLGMLVMEPGSLVMERKMLLGIKRRAERLAEELASELRRHESR